MKHLLAVLGLFWRADRKAFLIGLALMIATLAAGAALLGLAGWFIAAAALAGMAGAGFAFDYFTPGAAVRFLALVRAAARYGERVTTHDATLRFLADLRVRLFHGLAAQPFPILERLRSAVALNRITTDVDALDTVYLRIAAPVLAAIAVLLGALVVLSLLASFWVALLVVGLLAATGAGVAVLGVRLGRRASRTRALALEAVRVRLVDLAQGAVDLAFAGRLERQTALVADADRRAADAHRRLDAIDRKSGVAIALAVAVAIAGTLLLGALLGLDVTVVALAVLAVFALGETVQPLRRAALELGRAILAARRVGPAIASAEAEREARAAPPATPDAPGPADAADTRPGGATLVMRDVAFARGDDRAPVLDGFSLEARPGEWIALVGPSGGGKSTVLALGARLLAPRRGEIRLAGRPLAAWEEHALRGSVAMLSQRSELFAGTVAENLRLAAPDAGDEELAFVLSLVDLEDAVARLGGLSGRLGEGGSGLSGGEMRRLALARLVLRRPAVALLDEPTEGLDAPTAEKVLAGLRHYFAGATVLAASHRAEETAIADRLVHLGPPAPVAARTRPAAAAPA